MSNLEKLIKERIDNLNMKTFHTITDYMKGENYIKEEEISLIYDQIAKMNVNISKDGIIFEIAAHSLGFITEEELRTIITDFRGIEVVTAREIEQMKISFNVFTKEMCKKNLFFEYIDKRNDSPSTKLIVASFTTGEKINILLKRTISDYRIRYTLPSIIEPFLEKL